METNQACQTKKAAEFKQEIAEREREKKRRKEPNYKQGDKVYAEDLGFGIVYDSYLVKNEYLYHIKQKEFMMGNIPEKIIHKI